MLKKMVILAAVGFVGVTALSGTKIMSYFKSEWKSVREQAEESIPPEAEIARLKNEVALLDKDVKTLVNQLAKERVEVNLLKEKVDELAAAYGKDKELFNARLDAIEKAEKEQLAQVSFGTRTLGLKAALAELAAEKKRLETAQRTLTVHEGLLANRIKVRDNLEKQLEATKNQKSELANAVDSMEAELSLLKLQQVESKYQTDDTRMAKIKEDLRKLRTKVEVKREELKLTQTASDDTAPVAGAASVQDQVNALRGSANGKKPEAAKPEKKPQGD